MITKRQFGIGLVTFSALATIGLFGVELIGASDFRGIGPLQQMALIGAGIVFLVGLTLIPLGDRPA